MNVILLEKIQNLGGLGDLVNVKSGYARNFLIPYGKAVWATDSARIKVEERRQELAKLEEQRLDVARAKADTLPEEIRVIRKVSEEGKLYGSVSASDVASELQERGIVVGRAEISLPQGPIKEVGETTIDILLHPEIRVELRVTVEAEHSE
ncbi:MAG: 50S ribosomal protein L9 [Acidiferrobacteraceae bacterium]|nr:50S ribosomal protein L9 [Acidiferrobacteraceae bacterium]